jgi:hypothetical protein
MNWKVRLTVFTFAAILVGAVILRNDRARVEDKNRQTPLQAQAELTGRSVPPYYKDVRGVQVPRTLRPDRFTVPKTRSSYQVAARIPKVLMQLPCYCWCDRIDHKSLLDCFVDEHAEFCGICQDSALWANKRLKEQAAVETIRQEIMDSYAAEYGRR